MKVYLKRIFSLCVCVCVCTCSMCATYGWKVFRSFVRSVNKSFPGQVEILPPLTLMPPFWHWWLSYSQKSSTWAKCFLKDFTSITDSLRHFLLFISFPVITSSSLTWFSHTTSSGSPEHFLSFFLSFLALNALCLSLYLSLPLSLSLSLSFFLSLYLSLSLSWFLFFLSDSSF